VRAELNVHAEVTSPPKSTDENQAVDRSPKHGRRIGTNFIDLRKHRFRMEGNQEDQNPRFRHHPRALSKIYQLVKFR